MSTGPWCHIGTAWRQNRISPSVQEPLGNNLLSLDLLSVLVLSRWFIGRRELVWPRAWHTTNTAQRLPIFLLEAAGYEQGRCSKPVFFLLGAVLPSLTHSFCNFELLEAQMSHSSTELSRNGGPSSTSHLWGALCELKTPWVSEVSGVWLGAWLCQQSAHLALYRAGGSIPSSP